MKRFRKLVAILLAVGMMGAMSVASMAVEVEARAVPCSECSKGRILEGTDDDGWRHRSTIYDCAHSYPHGYDRLAELKTYITYHCTDCDFFEKGQVIDVETRLDCYGRDTILRQAE